MKFRVHTQFKLTGSIFKTFKNVRSIWSSAEGTRRLSVSWRGMTLTCFTGWHQHNNKCTHLQVSRVIWSHASVWATLELHWERWEQSCMKQEVQLSGETDRPRPIINVLRVTLPTACKRYANNSAAVSSFKVKSSAPAVDQGAFFHYNAESRAERARRQRNEHVW